MDSRDAIHAEDLFESLEEQVIRGIMTDKACHHTTTLECLNTTNAQCHISCEALMQYCYPEVPSAMDQLDIYSSFTLLTSMDRLRYGSISGCTGCLLILDGITTASNKDLSLCDFDVIVCADFDGSPLQVDMWYHPDRRGRSRTGPRAADDIHVEMFAALGMFSQCALTLNYDLALICARPVSILMFRPTCSA